MIHIINALRKVYVKTSKITYLKAQSSSQPNHSFMPVQSTMFSRTHQVPEAMAEAMAAQMYQAKVQAG